MVRVAGVSVNDGVWHEIRLERHGNVAELIVDASYRAQGAAPGVNDVLNMESNDVFFAAEVRLMPSLHQAFDDIRMAFVGCMDNIRMNDAFLPHQISAGPSAASSSLSNSNSNSPAPIATLKRFTNVEFNCRTSMALPGI